MRNYGIRRFALAGQVFISSGIFARSLVVWLLIAMAEMVHGTLRTIFLIPFVGDLRSRQIGVLTGSLIILAIAYFTIHWIRASRKSELLAVGLLWLVLMVSFETTLGRIFGLTWERILSDYLPSKGGFMVLGMVFLLLSPMIAFRLKARSHG